MKQMQTVSVCQYYRITIYLNQLRPRFAKNYGRQHQLTGTWCWWLLWRRKWWWWYHHLNCNNEQHLPWQSCWEQCTQTVVIYVSNSCNIRVSNSCNIVCIQTTNLPENPEISQCNVRTSWRGHHETTQKSNQTTTIEITETLKILQFLKT